MKALSLFKPTDITFRDYFHLIVLFSDPYLTIFNIHCWHLTLVLTLSVSGSAYTQNTTNANE